MNVSTLENRLQLIKSTAEAVRKYEYMNISKTKSRQNTSASWRDIPVQIIVGSSINDIYQTLDNDCKSWNQTIRSHAFTLLQHFFIYVSNKNHFIMKALILHYVVHLFYWKVSKEKLQEPLTIWVNLYQKVKKFVIQKKYEQFLPKLSFFNLFTLSLE